MERYVSRGGEKPILSTRRYIGKSIFALMFLVFSGCATVPTQPVTIKQEKISTRTDPVISDRQDRTEPADQSAAALVALLKSKNIISDEEAAKLTGRPVIRGVEEKIGSPKSIEIVETPAAAPEWAERVRFGGDIRLRSESDRPHKETTPVFQSAEPVTLKTQQAPSGNDAVGSDQAYRGGVANPGMAGLVALLRNKNIISPEEASRLMTAQSLPPAGEKGREGISEASEQERMEKITARAIEQVMGIIQDQVKKQVREELAKEMKKHEKEQIETITASVTEEIKKSLPERVKSEARGELAGEMKEKEESKKITPSVEEQKGLQEQVKSQAKEAVAKEIERVGLGVIADWIRRISIEGDVRLRYQGEFFDKNNALFLKPSNPTEILNTREDRNRFLGRGRFALTARITDEIQAGIRIATGSVTNPVSQNVVLGDYENNKAIALDQLYLQWKPVPSLSLWGGRMPNPFFYTDMVWDKDVNFDGLSLNYTLGFNNRYALFANALVSPLQELEISSDDKWLFGGQFGFQHRPWEGLNYKIATAYYHFHNITGKANDPLRPGEFDYTAPPFLQKGNTLFDIDPSPALKLALASEYRLVNLTGNIELGFWQPVYITLLGDYVRNVGFDRNRVARKTGDFNIKKQIEGFQVGLSVGHKQIRKFGDWELFFLYKRLEADAVLDAFTDSDFHGGGTNAKGWILGGTLGLYKNIWLTGRWLTADQIIGPPLAIDTLQLDLNLKF